jgi:hypothetical protein
MTTLSQVRKAFNVIDDSTFGNGFSATISEHSQLFQLVANGAEMTIYRAYLGSNGEVNLLPNYKTGKSLKMAQDYIERFAK